ncbi:WxL protein peptidoglycan domain-containing protein [Saccharothrix xinjiangensis]|uniref:WxL protein peptidoglycan domain-containing protein n=1 Tax=Saccharothrix xinjiangensis TaxID=204798 RepID=A0ABV9XYH6_9PSEU
MRTLVAAVRLTGARLFGARLTGARLFWAALVAVTLLPVPQAAAQPADDDARQTWSVAPASASGPDGRTRFDYVVEPGMRYDDHLAVRNLGEAELTLDLYAGDAVNTGTGGFDLLARDEASTVVGNWVAVSSPRVVVPARETAVVPFSVTVPADAEPGDHVGGLVAALTAGGDTPVEVERRVGSRLYARVAGPISASARIDSLTAVYRGTSNPAGAGEVDVTYTVVNEGNLRLALRPSARVSGLFGLGGRSTTGEVLPELLPGNAVTLTQTLAGVWPLGPLDVRVEAEPVASAAQSLGGAVEPATAGTSVWAVPWTALAALVLFLGTTTALWRVRRKIRALRGQPPARTPESAEAP